jgi:hypothetical protein
LIRVAQQSGGAALGLNCSNLNGDLQPLGTQTQVANIVVQRDDRSDRTAKIYADFFKEHPDHLQSGRFIREYQEVCPERAERGLPPLEDAPRQQPDGDDHIAQIP